MTKFISIFLLCFLFIPSLLSAQALSGNYTIGGVGPDFPNFNSAVSALTNNGIVSAVSFDVRSGIYNEQVRITPVQGVSASNTITFRSEVGDSSAVVLEYASTNSVENFTLALDTLNFITIQQITIRAKGINFGRALALRGGCNYNRILNNRLESTAGNGNSNQKAVFFSSDLSLDNYNLLQSNVISGGNIGIFMQGILPGNVESGNEIFNNQIGDSLTGRGVLAWFQDSLIIEKNEVSSVVPSSSWTGMQLQDCQEVVVLGNKIISLAGGYGFSLTRVDGISGVPNLVANNFAAVGGSGIYYAMQLVDCDWVDAVFNSLHHFGSNAIGGAMNVNGGSEIRLINDIFAASGGSSIPIYVSQAAAIDSINFNDYYSTGPNLGFFNGNHATLAAFQTATGQDASSLAVNPNFSSPTDLHVNQALLDGAGTYFAGINDDIDGDFRGLLAPDIGADEFDIFSLDLEPVSLSSFIFPLCNTSNNYTVQVLNQGFTIITSFQVNWAVNGIPQTPVTFSGSLAPGQTSAPISLGNYNFTAPANSNYDFEVWTSSPNGNPDQFTANDTLQELDFYRPLAGTYTVGGINPDFVSLAEAVTFLEKGGVCDSVVFNLRNGVYNEQIMLTEIRGASALQSVTFQSESGDSALVEINYAGASGTNCIVELDSSDFIRFRNLSFRTLSPSFSGIFCIKNGAHHNKIADCHLIAPFTLTGNALNHISVYSPIGTDSSNIFSRNHLEGNAKSFLFQGNASGIETGNRILNNEIENVRAYGVEVEFQENMEIRGNQFHRDSLLGGTTGMSGISGTACRKNLRIAQNEFFGFIHNGIDLNNGISLVGEETLIDNNFISVKGNGIVLNGQDGTKVLANNLLFRKHGDVTFRRIFEIAQTDRVEAFGNNLVNTAGQANNAYSLFLGSGNSNLTLDYNNLYSTGSQLVRYNSTDYPSLVNWQSLALQDANSVSLDPLYFADHDLHICNSSLVGAGIAQASIIVDFDGEARPANPTLGADEVDAQIYLPGDTTICSSIQLEVLYPGASYLWSTGNTDSTQVITLAGTYYVDITSPGCGTLSDTIEVLALNSLANGLGADTTGCDSVLIGNSYPGVSYAWGTGATSAQIVAPTSGSYVVTYTAACGSISDTIQVQAIASPAGFLGPDQQVCDDTIYTLYPGPLYNSFLWSTNSTNPTINVQQPGNYWVAVTDTFGCTGADTQLVTFSPYWQGVDLGPDDDLCSGQNTFFNAGPGYISYLWSDSSNGQLLITNQVGLYWVETVAADGCVYRDSIVLTPGIPPTPFLGNDTLVCPGTNLVLNGGNQYVAWSWQNGSTNSTYSVGGPGLYSVSVTDSAGCSGADTINISFHPFPVVSLGPDISFCPGSSVTLSPGTGFQSYLWQDNSGQASFVATNSGTYYVTAMDLNGCIGSDTVSLGLYSLPTVNLGPDTLLCPGDTLFADAGSGLNTYLWTPGSSTSQILPITQAGNYSVSVTDLNGCPGNDAITVSFSQAHVDLGSDTTLCKGNSLLLDAGGGFNSYLWMPGGTVAQTLIVDTSGTYAVEAINADGCSSVDAINVFFDGPTALFSFVDNQLTVVFNDASVGNGITHAWDFGDGSVSSQVFPTHTFAADGTYQVCLTVTDANGCTDTYCESISVMTIGFFQFEKTVFAVYPNPTRDRVWLKSEVSGPVILRLVGLQGQVIRSDVYSSAPGIPQEFSLEGLPAGLYLLQIETKESVQLVRIEVIQ